ncbi:nischarin-like isoform X2 [Acropora palmata]|uniref:nischarin-like isoform X2 n=1 Tax=Acropora palmata TaxID=6131 RepID=UPI003DA14A6F
MKIRKVLVPATEQVDSYTVYYLEVHIREYSWFVSRRYREFYELHEKLVKRYGIDQSLIPPKRYFGMRQPEYVEKRRLGLETYIQTLLLQFDDNLPQEIQDFLESDKFDVCGVTHSLAKELFLTGDEILAKDEQFSLTLVQLHCITRRLGMAAPTCASHIPHGEIGNLYDFLYQLRHLKICGAGTPVELSENISLKCNLSIFKSLKTLESLSNLVELDLSFNKISNLGGNLNAKLGNLRRLNLAGNELDSVEGLHKLYSLTVLNLSDNNFSNVGAMLSLGQLPCLESLDFRENEMTKDPLYRLRVFTAFDDRAEQLELDGHRPTNREVVRIRELLREEQNFEIINFPTPPQHVASKKLQTRNIDRVITLDSELPTSSPVTDSQSLVDESEVEFRLRVEQIRQTGGDSWLKILDEIRGKEDLPQQKDDNQCPSDISHTEPEPANNQCSPNLDMLVDGGASVFEGNEKQESAGVLLEDEVHPRRLKFGFAPELEQVVRDKVESSTDLTSGTYMVEVEREGHNQEGTEERMVGVDLSKGVILEIQIATGETFARHNLEHVSSVDILKLNNVFCVDIRDMTNKEWRRHCDSASSGQNKDYRQVAQYRMRSIEDAAEFFALLYKLINARSMKESIPDSPVQLESVFAENSVEWRNPLGINQKLLHRFFENFLRKHDPTTADTNQEFPTEGPRRKRTQTIYQALRAQFIDVGCLRHDRSGPSPEMVRLVLWSSCLPYVCPERELSICLLMTNINIYLFHSPHLDSPEVARALTEVNDLLPVLKCFYSFPVRELSEVVFGLYDQSFRMEVKLEGPRGTFTVLTRDATKTDNFFGTLRDVLGEPLNEEEQFRGPRFRRQFSSSSLPRLLFPDEERIERLKSELSKSATVLSSSGQDLLMYSIVREIPESNSVSAQDNEDLAKMLRSLIVTNAEIFLCDEDHVHWPLPSFLRAPPSTPQWVVTKSQLISKIIGLEVYELTGRFCEFLGANGLSLIFEQEESMTTTSAGRQNCWHLIFRAADERTKLQRSLSQVWKDNFQADLKITWSKPKSFPVARDVYDLRGFLESSSSIGVEDSPVGTPVEAKKNHRRVGSDNFPISRSSGQRGLESLAALEHKALDQFFEKCISQKAQDKVETLLHVLWTGCTPYLFPSQEFEVCVLLSNLYLYILTGKEHKSFINKRKGVKVRLPGCTDDSKISICFNLIPLDKLRQVCVGLFDQTLRIETELKHETFTFITRDFHLTNTFLECLNTILTSNHSGVTAPRADTLAPSIYDSELIADANPSASTKTDYQHTNSGVRFVYPNDDTLEILKDVIAEFSRHSVDCSQLSHVVILVYLLVFHETETKTEEPRTLVIMDKALCLCIEDHVNYPLPLFATGLPENPQYNVQDLRDIKSLSRVEFSDFNSCDFKIVFSPNRHQDEDAPDGFESASLDDLCVITHQMDDPEECNISWRVIAQNYEEKEKALSLICKLWAEIHGGALPVMKAKN